MNELPAKKLEEMSDAELSEVFAVEVCRSVRPIPSSVEGVRFYEDTRNGALRRSDWRNDFWTEFATSADAVLPYLEKWRAQCTRTAAGKWRSAKWRVAIVDRQEKVFVGQNAQLARAACIAFILATRAAAEAKEGTK